MSPSSIININLGAGTQGFGAGPQRRPVSLAPRAMRISKKKKKWKKEKKETMKTNASVLAEARRLEEAATKEEKEASRKRAKAEELKREAGEMEGGKKGEEVPEGDLSRGFQGMSMTMQQQQ